jgi:hypothetical protein
MCGEWDNFKATGDSTSLSVIDVKAGYDADEPGRAWDGGSTGEVQ